MSIPSLAFSVVLFKLSLKLSFPHLAVSHLLDFSVSLSLSVSTHEALRLMGHGLA
jgi:hypothetical protein